MTTVDGQCNFSLFFVNHWAVQFLLHHHSRCRCRHHPYFRWEHNEFSSSPCFFLLYGSQEAMIRLNIKLLFFHALNHFQSIDFRSIELEIELLLLYYQAHLIWTHTFISVAFIPHSNSIPPSWYIFISFHSVFCSLCFLFLLFAALCEKRRKLHILRKRYDF